MSKQRFLGGLLGANPLRGTPASGDANWSDVTLLVDNTSVTTDRSSNQHSGISVAVGTVSTGTTNGSSVPHPYGSSGVPYLDFSSARVELPSSVDLSGGDWTMETWAWFDAISEYASLFSSPDGGWQLDFDSSAQLRFNGTGTALTKTGALSTNTWHFVSLSYVAATQTLYLGVDGAVESSSSADFATMTADYMGGSGNDVIRIGQNRSHQYPQPHDGKMSDIRFTAGVARYTGAFTPPTEALPLGAAVAATFTNVVPGTDPDYSSPLTPSTQSVSGLNTLMYGPKWNSDGSRLEYYDDFWGAYAYFTASTAYDITTLSQAAEITGQTTADSGGGANWWTNAARTQFYYVRPNIRQPTKMQRFNFNTTNGLTSEINGTPLLSTANQVTDSYALGTGNVVDNNTKLVLPNLQHDRIHVYPIMDTFNTTTALGVPALFSVSNIEACAMHPDGEFIAVLLNDGTLKMFEMSTAYDITTCTEVYASSSGAYGNGMDVTTGTYWTPPGISWGNDLLFIYDNDTQTMYEVDFGKLGSSTDRTTSNVGILSLDEAGPEDVSATIHSQLNNLDGFDVVGGTTATGLLLSTSSVAYQGADIDITNYLPSSGYVYWEARVTGSSIANLFTITGLWDGSADLSASQVAVAATRGINATGQQTKRYGDNGALTYGSNDTNLDRIQCVLVDVDSGDMWLGQSTATTGAVRWASGTNGSENTSFTVGDPSFSGLDLTTYKFLLGTMYHASSTIHFNFGGNPLFNGEETSGNDSATWYNDPPVTVSSLSISSSETREITQLNWGAMTGRSLVVTGAASAGIGSGYPGLTADSVWTVVSDTEATKGTGGRRLFVDAAVPTSGKYYMEVWIDGNTLMYGIGDTADTGSWHSVPGAAFYPQGNFYMAGGGFVGLGLSGATPTDEKVVGLAFDFDNNKMFGHLEGAWFPASGDPSAGGAGITPSSITGTAAVGVYSNQPGSAQWNHGNNGTFGGNVTAGGNTDTNGVGDFKYSVPTGYQGFYTSYTAGAAATTSLDNTGILSLSEMLQASYGVAAAAAWDGTGVEMLMVGGGGGGGGSGQHNGAAGGGGAGAYRALSNQTVTMNNAYSITVGSGGTGGAKGLNSSGDTGQTKGGDGGATSFFGYTQNGGGAGGAANTSDASDRNANSSTGTDGGSGGGAGYNGSGGSGGSLGNNGGNGGSSSPWAGGGGGGAGAAGGSAGSGSSSGGGDGGDGLQWAVNSTYYAGGGAGGSEQATGTAGGSGGKGGGGAGLAATAKPNSLTADAGAANTGSGGGAAGGPGACNGGAGGSGVVKIWIPVAGYTGYTISGLTVSADTNFTRSDNGAVGTMLTFTTGGGTITFT